MGGGENWWTDEAEYDHIESYVLAVLCAVTLIIELVHHRLEHAVEHEAQHHKVDWVDHDGEDEAAHHLREEVYAQSSGTFNAMLMRHATGELTVLGCLAFGVWTTARLGGFDKLVGKWKDYNGIKLPPTSSDLLHLVEDVHMHLFLSFIMLMIIAWISFKFLLRKLTFFTDLDRKLTKGEIVCGCTVDHAPIGLTHEDALVLGDLVYLQSRALFFDQMRRWDGRSPALGEVVELLEELHPATETHDVIARFQSWFQFHALVRLQCYHLLTLLLKIHPFLWGYTAVMCVISAQPIRATRDHMWRSLFLCATFFLAGCITAAVSALAYKRRHGTPIATQADKMSPKVDTTESDVLDRISVAKLLMTFVQIFLVSWCYFVMRILASHWYWAAHPGEAVAMLFLGTISVVGLGVFLGLDLIPRFALYMLRGMIPPQLNQIQWTHVLVEREMQARHRQASRASRRLSRMGTQRTLSKLEGATEFAEVAEASASVFPDALLPDETKVLRAPSPTSEDVVAPAVLGASEQQSVAQATE